ncbi:unnamed protein product, partial [Brassica rapa subsp. narinosa]
MQYQPPPALREAEFQAASVKHVSLAFETEIGEIESRYLEAKELFASAPSTLRNLATQAVLYNIWRQRNS